ncbi:hypothetical protein L9F63_014719, partial [Diploptera punctata]
FLASKIQSQIHLTPLGRTRKVSMNDSFQFIIFEEKNYKGHVDILREPEKCSLAARGHITAALWLAVTPTLIRILQNITLKAIISLLLNGLESLS